MSTALVLLVLVAGVAALVDRLNANHRRVAGWPVPPETSDRDAARQRADLAAARSASALGVRRVRASRRQPAGRRTAPPTARAA